MLHKNIDIGDIHVPYQWIYADATARNAATGFVAADVGKLARQLSNNTLWILTDESPITWLAVSLEVGVDVQAYDADTAKLDVSQSWTAQQTFKELKDTVHTIVDGAAFEIDPANGSIQVVTLGADRTPAATNFEAGQTVLLGIDDGTAYTITWTSSTFGTNGTGNTNGVRWVKPGGTASAPALATTGYTWVLLWKVGAQVYGAEVGKP